MPRYYGVENRDYFGAAERGRVSADESVRRRQANALGGYEVQKAERLNSLAQNPQATAEQYARAGQAGIANSLTNLQNNTREQQKLDSQRLYQAAQYGMQSQSPKAFIQQNYPEIAQLNPNFANESDEEVRAGLQEMLGRFGPQAGIGPSQARGKGPLYKVVDPETGAVTYATSEDAAGGTPYIYQPPTKQNPAPPRGYRYKTDGGLEPIPGGPADPSLPPKPTQAKPPGEGDKRARVMYRSMQNSEKQLETISSSDTSDLGQAILGKAEAGKALQSDDFKRYEAAGLRWAANLLYLKSGATATPDEIRSTWLQFFPQPGDGAAVKGQKEEARQQELSAIQEAYGFDIGGQAPYMPPKTNQPSNNGIVTVNSPQEAMNLPPGTKFRTPDGRVKVRP